MPRNRANKPSPYIPDDAKQIPGFSRYFITKDGTLFNEWGLLLRHQLTVHGYRNVNLQPDGDIGRKNMRVHRLVVMTWIGPIPDGMQVNHLDGDKQNCRVENLQICTAMENFVHARDVLKNTAIKGEGSPSAKLTELRCAAIRELYSNGWRQQQLGAIFDVSTSLISTVVNQKTWKDAQK